MTTTTATGLAKADAFWKAIGGRGLEDWLKVRPSIIVLNEVPVEGISSINAIPPTDMRTLRQ